MILTRCPCRQQLKKAFCALLLYDMIVSKIVWRCPIILTPQSRVANKFSSQRVYQLSNAQLIVSDDSYIEFITVGRILVSRASPLRGLARETSSESEADTNSI